MPSDVPSRRWRRACCSSRLSCSVVLYGAHTAYRCKLRFVIDGTASAGTEMSVVGLLTPVARGRSANVQWLISKMYAEAKFLYQKTHSKCTKALQTAQRDLIRKKKNDFSTPPILRFSRRPRLLAAIAAPLDRRRPRFRSELTLLAV